MTRSSPRPHGLGVKAKFWLTIGPRTLFGDGKADLLEAVDRLGSLRSAAQSMGMSYRHAWGLLRELDKAAGFAFLEHSGTGRTNLRLTDNAQPVHCRLSPIPRAAERTDRGEIPPG